MYTCREIEKLLDTYTDGELDEPRRLRVEAHLRGCALCSRLVRCKEEEARLIRSGDPVPALSAGFTAQVVSNLTRSDFRARGEGFFSLGKVLARPWLAPALAGLMLLVTVSWAASRHLLPVIPGQVALQNSTMAGRAAQMPQTPVSSGNNNLSHQDNLVLSLPQGLERKDTRGSGGKKALNISEGSTGGAPSPQENKGAAAENPDTGSGAAYKTLETQTTNPAQPQPTSYQELEQQGYTVFMPDYLPPGYSLESCSPQPPASGGSSAGSTQEVAPHPGQDSLLLTYRNDQTVGLLTLEILPLNGPAQQPVTTSANATENQASGAPASANATGNQTAGTTASANATGNQPPGADQITWQAQKNGASFMLTVTGSLPDEELKRVAASVH
jgi:anti-sigma factor RsiW